MYFNSGSFKIDTSDIQKKFNKFEKALSDPSGVFTKTLGDMQRRAPGKVADAVRNIYNIKKSDVMPSKKKTDLKKAGSIRIKGQSISELTLHYEGRSLTPLHFYFEPLELPQRESGEDAIKYNVQVSPFMWRAVNKPIPIK